MNKCLHVWYRCVYDNACDWCTGEGEQTTFIWRFVACVVVWNYYYLHVLICAFCVVYTVLWYVAQLCQYRSSKHWSQLTVLIICGVRVICAHASSYTACGTVRELAEENCMYAVFLCLQSGIQTQLIGSRTHATGLLQCSHAATCTVVCGCSTVNEETAPAHWTALHPSSWLRLLLIIQGQATYK